MRKIYYNRTWAKDRGKVKASQVSRTKPGPEKGHRWCRLREIPRRGRGPSRHGLGLSNVRSPPHNQAHFPSGKDGVFFILWVLPGDQFPCPWKAGRSRKDVPGRLQKGSKESPEAMQEIRPPGKIWKIFGKIFMEERSREVWRDCQPISFLDFVLCLQFRKVINTCICRVCW